MRQRLAKFMYGRYGSDQFGRFLSIASIALLVVGMIVQNAVGMLLTVCAIACLVYCYYRMFSKKISDRSRENEKYLHFKYKITGWFRQKKDRWKQRKIYLFFKCPQCGVTVRMPRGKGKVRITCPKCSHSFLKNT